MRELEIGEIQDFGFNLQIAENYPHGAYRCDCGKMFHGHWNRTAHYATCPNHLALLEKAGE